MAVYCSALRGVWVATTEEVVAAVVARSSATLQCSAA